MAKMPANARAQKSPANARSHKSPANARSQKSPANARSHKSPANARCRGCRQGGVVPASSHSHAEKDGEVDMLRADVKDSAWSAADVASMMACSTPGHVSIRVGCVALG